MELAYIDKVNLAGTVYDIGTTPTAVGIVEEGATSTHTISAGQYVIWRGSLYKARTAIPSGTTLGTSNLSSVTNGGFNDLIEKSTFANSDFSAQNASVTLGNCTGAKVGHIASVNLYFSVSAEIASYTTIIKIPAGLYPPVEMQVALTHYSTGIVYYGILNANGEVRTRKALPSGNPIIASISYPC